ncbi:MAG: galactose mutarotase [Sphaerochaetaceae bacterium]|nr:galactose mutarotase [Sphaerochaetaceae bacterium]
MITKTLHGQTKKGETAYLYTLKAGAYSAVISTFGGTLVEMNVPDKNGNVANVVLSYGTLAEYEDNSTYFGAIVGRYANRIRNAEFTLDGITYHLDKNAGEHTLHSGFDGFNHRIFEAEEKGDDKCPVLHLTLNSPENDMGFPAGVDLSVDYSLDDEGNLTIQYHGKCSGKTPLNLTNHAYFNLKGSDSVLDHELYLNCDRYLLVDDELVPTGVIASVKSTPLDFTSPKKIGAEIEKAGGYDHCMIAAEDNTLSTALAVVNESESGRRMKVYTTLESVQFYSGNFLDGSDVDKEGTPYEKHYGFCLETQHYPDAVNHDNFPSSLYDREKDFDHTTIYSFSTI